MATTEDIVRVRIEVDGIIRGLEGAKRSIRSLKPLGAAIGRGIGGAIAGGFAVAAGLGGLGLLTRGIVGLQSEVKDTEVGIASLVTALTGQDITTSLGQARTIVGQLKEDAALGAGELGNYAEGFQRILGPANRAGATLKEVRELNRQALAAGFALRGAEGLLLAPMDVVQALTAGVGERTTPIVNQLLGAIQMTNKEFNALSKRDRFDALTRAFGTMDEGAKLMGKTFSAQTATFKDGVKDIIRNATEPIFQVWTDQLSRANEWMTDNRDLMKEMAEEYGPKIAKAWEAVSRSPGAAAGGLGAAALAPGIGGFARAGGVGALGAVAGGGALTGGVVLAGLLAALAFGFLAVKGAISEYPELLESTAAAGSMLLFSFTKLFDAIGGLTGEGSALNRVGAIIVGTFNTSVDLFARGILVVAAGINFLGSGFLQLGMIMDAISSGDPRRVIGLFQAGSKLETVGREANALLVQELSDALTKPLRITKVRSNKVGEDDDGLGLTKPGQGDVNINKIEVKIKTDRMDDPNRVAVSFETMLARANEYRRQARTAGLAPKAI